MFYRRIIKRTRRQHAEGLNLTYYDYIAIYFIGRKFKYFHFAGKIKWNIISRSFFTRISFIFKTFLNYSRLNVQ